MREEKLSNFGYTFQTKLISCLMTDKPFTGQVFDLLKEDYFESQAMAFLIENCLSYFREYNELATLPVLKVKIDPIKDELLKQEVLSTLRDSCNQTGSTDLEFIKETTIEFCKNQEIKNAIIESVDLLTLGNYDRIKELIDDALKIGMDNEVGLDYLDNIDARYNENVRDPIPTPWDVINNITKGGFSAGDLVVCIAPTGAGKSWWLASIGAYATKLGKTVLHYTLELSEDYTALRYDCINTGIPLDKLEMNLSEVKNRLEGISGKLIIKEFPTKGVSLTGLKAHANKLQMLGIQPDIILLDYGDLMAYESKNYAKHDSLETLYNGLKGFAKEIGAPLFTVSQTHRDGSQETVVEGDSIAGAFAKIFPTDFACSLSRKASDKISDTARLHIIKNRFGIDGITFPMHMDTNKGILRVYEASTDQGRGQMDKMKSDTDYQKSMLNKRFRDLESELNIF